MNDERYPRGARADRRDRELFTRRANMEWPHPDRQRPQGALPLQARSRLRRDERRDRDRRRVSRGRLMTGRQWSDGLHQAVEAKERVKIKEENQNAPPRSPCRTSSSSTASSRGMTRHGHDRGERVSTRSTSSTSSRSPTNKAAHATKATPDVIYRTDREKYHSIRARDPRGSTTTGPADPGRDDVRSRKSEEIAAMLTDYGVKHQVP